MVRSFHNGSASGPFGLFPGLLKLAVDGRDTEGNLFNLTQVVTLLASGAAPLEVAPIVAGASLVALVKPDKGVRPIAVGEALRRLTSKCLCEVNKEKAREILLPDGQTGVAVPSGIEAAVHTVRQYARNHANNPRKAILQIDYKNAFNSVKRKAIINALKENFPALIPWVRWCYDSPSHLRFRDNIILSEEGVQQGDPLGPLLFSLAIRPVLRRLRSECCLNVLTYFLDDGILCGDIEELAKAFKILKEESQKLGLTVNEGKCELTLLHP